MSGWNDIIVVAAGYSHVLGLRRDGTVVSAGENDYGQCDVTEWNDIIFIAADGENSFGLRRDGTVIAVGKNNYGQCDVEYWERIVSISASRAAITGIREDGVIHIAGIGNEMEYMNNFVAGFPFIKLCESGHIINNLSDMSALEEYTAADIVTIAYGSTGKDFWAGIRMNGTFTV